MRWKSRKTQSVHEFSALIWPTAQRVHANVVSQAGRVIVELEPVADHDEVVTPLQLVAVLLSRMQQARTVQKLCDLTAERIKVLIRYDRVMIYKFLHDGAGRVIAEAKRSDLVSF